MKIELQQLSVHIGFIQVDSEMWGEEKIQYYLSEVYILQCHSTEL